METPECCGQKTEFIGVTESGGDKFHCSVCYQIKTIAHKKRVNSPEGLSNENSD